MLFPMLLFYTFLFLLQTLHRPFSDKLLGLHFVCAIDVLLARFRSVEPLLS